MQNSSLRERSADVRELGQRVLAYLQEAGDAQRPELPEDIVLVAEEVTAPMMADFPLERLRGIVSLKGSRNSHGAILADALGIPTVMGALDVPIYTVEGQTTIVDGYYGEVFVSPGAVVRDSYSQFAADEEDFARELEALRDLPSETRDGHAINLWVNIGLVSEITRSLDRGAEGIGLFRTEVPFSMGDRFPTEEEQRVAYREHMEAFEPRPVTMRTLDIGGDKPLSYFPIEEENPFLGWRGIRVTLDHPEIFLGQVRAMVKANAGLEGILRIMLPMVSRLEQIEEAKALIHRAHREVVEEGYAVRTPLIGVMIEVPAAIYLTREIARIVDFLAVGSNDLTQYMLAVDRNNPRVADLFEEVHPSMLIALRQIAKDCHMEDKPIGICGELAGTPEGAVLCVGMGYDVLSMNAANLPRVKWVIRSMSLRDCRRILARALRMRSSKAILHFVREQLVEAGLERAVPHHEVPAGF
jgi:phosphotransferase system enzyme I (PtsP)